MIGLMALRSLRWALWLTYLGYSVYFVLHRTIFFNSLGHLLPSSELVLFGLPGAAVFVGFMELMLREKLGISKEPPPSQFPMGR
jgi:hypothetical protein